LACVTVMVIPTSPKVWVRSQPCFFGTSVFESVSKVIGNVEAKSYFDRIMVPFAEINGEINFAEEKCDGKSTHIPMGRARECLSLNSTACPTTVLESQLATKNSKIISQKPYVQLAVVGLVVNHSAQKILLTRRPIYMRSFPGAWVFPGGTVEDNESLSQTISRELKEETGLIVADWTPLCIWESVYPTDSQPKVPTRAHHAVVYMSASLPSQQPLKLCKTEVDKAIWLSRKDARILLEETKKLRKNTVSIDSSTINSFNADLSNPKSDDIILRDLLGVYPQYREEEGESVARICGLAQGSLFALEEFWASVWCKSMEEES